MTSPSTEPEKQEHMASRPDRVHPDGEEGYRGWHIEYNPPPIPVRTCDWQFWHVDYDGPEDSRCGFAPSLEAAKAEIDEREDDA